mmetsp:Transcript_13083/g.15021  ORF Transcript_13083/g.15021 Transcript_13083/m.15021 type:complete len:220 (+) Transcript_13083:207-866(+)
MLLPTLSNPRRQIGIPLVVVPISQQIQTHHPQHSIHTHEHRIRRRSVGIGERRHDRRHTLLPSPPSRKFHNRRTVRTQSFHRLPFRGILILVQKIPIGFHSPQIGFQWHIPTITIITGECSPPINGVLVGCPLRCRDAPPKLGRQIPAVGVIIALGQHVTIQPFHRCEPFLHGGIIRIGTHLEPLEVEQRGGHAFQERHEHEIDNANVTSQEIISRGGD